MGIDSSNIQSLIYIGLYHSLIRTILFIYLHIPLIAIHSKNVHQSIIECGSKCNYTDSRLLRIAYK